MLVAFLFLRIEWLVVGLGAITSGPSCAKDRRFFDVDGTQIGKGRRLQRYPVTFHGGVPGALDGVPPIVSCSGFENERAIVVRAPIIVETEFGILVARIFDDQILPSRFLSH